jgi:beta-lactamase superfamily II metal-dependent hydrolase
MRFILSALFLAALSAYAAKPLEIFFIDVEGGQSTLIVSPSGQSMLVDTGWPGYSNRDANRIADAAKKAGVKKIDYVFITHFHTDHVGGAKQLVDRIPVGTFIDKGKTVETDKNAKEMTEIYDAALNTSQKKNGPKPKRMIIKAGDTIPVKGLDIQVVQAGGEAMAPPSGAVMNPSCANAVRKEADPSDNAQSAGFLLKFGDFRFVDLGDLTWNKEIDLVCPVNRIGHVDVFLVSHHGLDQSNSPTLLEALTPRVAVMNNGARKGGSPAAWKVVHGSKGLEDLWQLHFAVEGAKETNVSDPFIANIDTSDEGHYILLTAEPDGSFKIVNSRNKYSKTYAK